VSRGAADGNRRRCARVVDLTTLRDPQNVTRSERGFCAATGIGPVHDPHHSGRYGVEVAGIAPAKCASLVAASVCPLVGDASLRFGNDTGAAGGWNLAVRTSRASRSRGDRRKYSLRPDSSTALSGTAIACFCPLVSFAAATVARRRRGRGDLRRVRGGVR
jgi:hypothetical protein